MKIITVCALVFVFFCQTITAQTPKPAFNPNRQYTIPFLLTSYNNLRVQAVLNNTDTVQLMFHTASSSVTLTEAAIKKITSWHVNRTDSVKSWGGNGASQCSQYNTVQIQGMQWDSIAIWEDKNSGQFTDGKFGTDLFANQVIDIDFVKNRITISPALPRKIKKYTKCKLTHHNDMLFIEAQCTMGNTNCSNLFLIHSGYAGAVLFDDQFVAENGLTEKLQVIGEKDLKDSYGHILKTKKAILPVLKIGNDTLQNVPAGFFEGAIGRQKMSVLGGDVLKRFNIIIDAQREYIYLKANALKNSNYTNT